MVLLGEITDINYGACVRSSYIMLWHINAQKMFIRNIFFHEINQYNPDKNLLLRNNSAYF